MTTKIGLPENRKRLKGAGIEHARSESFDEGYNAGWNACIEYQKQQSEIKKEGDQLRSPSLLSPTI